MLAPTRARDIRIGRLIAFVAVMLLISVLASPAATAQAPAVATPASDEGAGLDLPCPDWLPRLQEFCPSVVLDTHTFQTPVSYERHGFRRIAAIPDYPPGSEKILYRKALG